MKYDTHKEIRTLTVMVLSHVPLPLGYMGVLEGQYLYDRLQGLITVAPLILFMRFLL